ncbi:hypothetical protein TREES_T100000865 [Tupaia chinensis]|uniref:Uncharacterized protein n=1 Tax=Tupaia chinensis TaxID=246437 RepID=L9JEL0_TUPCH|nr:hypothetical protein TREES_T100000865 [Tupaia chinensis]
MEASVPNAIVEKAAGATTAEPYGQTSTVWCRCVSGTADGSSASPLPSSPRAVEPHRTLSHAVGRAKPVALRHKSSHQHRGTHRWAANTVPHHPHRSDPEGPGLLCSCVCSEGRAASGAAWGEAMLGASCSPLKPHQWTQEPELRPERVVCSRNAAAGPGPHLVRKRKVAVARTVALAHLPTWQGVWASTFSIEGVQLRPSRGQPPEPRAERHALQAKCSLRPRPVTLRPLSALMRSVETLTGLPPRPSGLFLCGNAPALPELPSPLCHAALNIWELSFITFKQAPW